MPRPALAAAVFLDGLNINGTTSRVIENCRVEFDAQGNILITSQGASVKGQGAPAASRPNAAAKATQFEPIGGPVSNRYWVVTEKSSPGLTQYDVDMFINNHWVRRFLSGEGHVVLELTKFLRAGPNTITVVARKQKGQVRQSASPQHFFRLVVGQGKAAGRDVMITTTYLDYKRTAAETEDFNQDFTIKVR